MPLTDVDHGYDAMLRRFREASKGRAVDVGVMGSEATQSYEDGVTVADVAGWMEFNTYSGGVRSWLRDYVDPNKARLETALEEMAKRVVMGRIPSLDQGLSLIGPKIQKEIQARIKSGIAPPNAPATIARKRSSGTLRDKGQFWSSITWAFVKVGAT